MKRSLAAVAGGLFRLPRALSPTVAMEVVLTGDPIPAQRAYDLGMVNQLVEPGKAIEGAIALAERICANAPLAVRETRKIVRAALTTDDETLWKMSFAAMATLAGTEDFAEGPAPSSRSARRCGRAGEAQVMTPRMPCSWRNSARPSTRRSSTT